MIGVLYLSWYACYLLLIRSNYFSSHAGIAFCTRSGEAKGLTVAATEAAQPPKPFQHECWHRGQHRRRKQCMLCATEASVQDRRPRGEAHEGSYQSCRGG
eukprot:SAG31_NODE_14155_length_824_cov_1.329655_1_plen_99_part_10